MKKNKSLGFAVAVGLFQRFVTEKNVVFAKIPAIGYYGYRCG
jgi:hypothetical protein